MTDRLEGYRLYQEALTGLRHERDLLILDLWRNGHGVTDIATAAGLSRRAVYDILRDHDALEEDEGEL
jgi:hypothetical protein